MLQLTFLEDSPSDVSYDASFCSSQVNQVPREKTIYASISHLDLQTMSLSPNYTVTTFVKGCSRSDPSRPNIAADFLGRLPASDVVIWTDGSVPYPLGVEGVSDIP